MIISDYINLFNESILYVTKKKSIFIIFLYRAEPNTTRFSIQNITQKRKQVNDNGSDRIPLDFDLKT